MSRYFSPLVGSIFIDARSTVTTLRELQKIGTSSDYGRYLNFQVQSMMDNYVFLLYETNVSVVKVSFIIALMIPYFQYI